MLVLGLLCLGFDCFSTNHGCSISGLNSLLAGSAPKSLVCSAMAPKNQGQEPAETGERKVGAAIDPSASNKSAGMSHLTKTDINELSSLPEVAVVEYSVPTEDIHHPG